MKQKIFVTVLIILMCVASVWASRHFFFRFKPLTMEESTALRTIGKPNSPIWIVEYYDYQCGPCKGASELIDKLLKKHPSKIYFQTRFFPLANHPHAFKAALHAECAAEQGKFWEYHKLLFSKQPEWSPATPYEVDAYFKKYAKETGLDVKRMNACVESPNTTDIIRKEIENAHATGVNSTPTFYINGEMVVGMPALEEALARLAIPENNPS